MDSGRPAFMLRYLMSRTWVSVLGLLAAGMAAIVAFFFVASSDYGGKLDLATSVVETSALYVLVGVAFVQKRRRLLAPLLALGAAALCTGIGLVAADSATYVFVVGCEFSCQNGPVTGMGWLFALWGVPAALLLLRAFGAWKRVEPPARRLRTPRIWLTGA